MYRIVMVASGLILALWSPLLLAGDSTDPVVTEAPAATSSVLTVPAARAERPVSQRLRFRSNGPTCVCGDGLREQDIRRASTETPDDDNRGEKR